MLQFGVNVDFNFMVVKQGLKVRLTPTDRYLSIIAIHEKYTIEVNKKCSLFIT